MMFAVSVVVSMPMLTGNSFDRLAYHFTIEVHKDTSVENNAGRIKYPDKNDDDGSCRPEAVGKVSVVDLPSYDRLTDLK